ncbi:MAG: hypothetical protein AAGN82_26120 [Myxococcota bacterium]
MKNRTYKLAATLTLLCAPLGCMVDTEDEGLDEGDVLIEDAGDLGTVQDAQQNGVILCSDPNVDPSTPAGNALTIRDSADDVFHTSPHQCAVLGQVFWDQVTDEVHDIAADEALTTFSSGTPTCGTCLAMQPPPPPGPGSFYYTSFYSRVSTPTYSLPLGWHGSFPSPYAGWHRSASSSAYPGSAYTSYCETAHNGLYWGELTDPHGYELDRDYWGLGVYGTNAYTMAKWVWSGAYWSVYTYAASVGSTGRLQHTPRVDGCDF